MTTRDRTLALGVISLPVLGLIVYVLAYQLYLTPLSQRQATLRVLEKDIQTREERLDQITAAMPKLERWKKISLPPDAEAARREYVTWLGELFRKSGYREVPPILSKPADSKTSPQLPGKKPVYSTLTFTVQSRATLESLVKALEGFSNAPLLHRVKNITIQKPETSRTGQRPDELDINLTIEALIVQGIKPRPKLLPDDKSVQDTAKLASAKRDYSSIGAKNVFLGPVPNYDQTGPVVDITPYIFLTDIAHTGTEGSSYKRSEARLYDRYNNISTRLASRAAFDSFCVKVPDGNKDKILIQGKVLRIDERSLVFEAEGDDHLYVLGVGHSLEEALAKPIATKKQLGQLFGELAFPGAP